MRTTCTPRLVLDRQDKLETDFYFQAMAVCSMQLHVHVAKQEF